MVSVHGEFYEQSDRGGELRRSFDRTFLLGPPAQTNPGSQCVVVSDLLVLRPWSGRDAWVPEDNAVGPAASGVDPQALVEEMRRRTGMNEQYTRILLQECNGDLEAGMRRFEEAHVASKLERFANFRHKIKSQPRRFNEVGFLMHWWTIVGSGFK